MPEKKKKTKKDIKVRHRDLKPRKDPKGGPGGTPPGKFGFNFQSTSQK